MQVTSRAYKTEQKGYLRNESYVWVYLGVISKEAQQNATINGTFAPFSDETEIFDNPDFEGYYATCEQNYANENMYFLPRDTGAFALYQGAVTDDFADSVTFRFGTYTQLNIKGLTIDFGEFYPKRFRVSNGIDTFEYTNTNQGVWTTEDEFLYTDHITITPLEMVGGSQRMRILSIQFGVGLTFSNKQLISTSYKHAVSHISANLPTVTFTFTVDNSTKKFASDDPHSFISFLQEQQEVSFAYGRKLDDEIYNIKGGKMYLKSWSSNDQQAKFTTVGFLDYISGTYNKGRYYPDGITLYDLAEDILEDAGIENYILDTYLKKITTHNPVPVQSHKNLLQLIANTAMAVMYEDRDGNLVIKTSFEPEVEDISTNSEEVYSILDAILEDRIKGDYATCEADYACADGHQYFLPRSGSYIDTAYTSEEITDGTGAFAINPYIEVEFEAKWSFFNPTVVFDTVYPTRMTVYTYADGAEIEHFDIETVDYTTIIEHAFVDVDTIKFVFTNGRPNQRIHIDLIKFGTVTDYTLGYVDMAQSPTATVADKVKSIVVHYYEYDEGTERKSVSTKVASQGENTVTFNTPYHGYQLSYKNGESGTLSIVDSGAYYVTFTSSISASVEVSAIAYVVSDSSVSAGVGEVGSEKTSQNVLIDNAELAERQALWLAEYFTGDLEYDVTYRGEPAIDPDDQIYLENKYIEDNLIRVSSTQIDTSTGMSLNCKLSAKRLGFRDKALINVARINISEVVGQ